MMECTAETRPGSPSPWSSGCVSSCLQPLKDFDFPAEAKGSGSLHSRLSVQRSGLGQTGAVQQADRGGHRGGDLPTVRYEARPSLRVSPGTRVGGSCGVAHPLTHTHPGHGLPDHFVAGRVGCCVGRTVRLSCCANTSHSPRLNGHNGRNIGHVPSRCSVTRPCFP